MSKIAVIMSTYNPSMYLKEQLKSIMGQQLSPGDTLSIIIRDDGSPEEWPTELMSLIKDFGIEVVKGANVGPAMSFYQLLSIAEGYDYYYFSDQDDIWDIRKITIMMDSFHLLEKQGRDTAMGVYSDLWVADADGKIDGKRMKKSEFPKTTDQISMNKFHEINLFRKYFVTGASFAINAKARSNALHLGKQVFELTVMHDSTIATMLLLDGNLTYVDEPLVRYRQHGNNVFGVVKAKSLLNRISRLSENYEKKLTKIWDVWVVARSMNLQDTAHAQNIAYLTKMFTSRNFLTSLNMLWRIRRGVFFHAPLIGMVGITIFGGRTLQKFKYQASREL